MKEQKPPSTPAMLRPHHVLCAIFFEGKGYSPSFVENMTAFLSMPDQGIMLTSSSDALCQACPNMLNNHCVDEAKSSLFDQRVLHLTRGRLQQGETTTLRDLCAMVYEDILLTDLLAEVCGECEWASLCQTKWQHGEVNPALLQPDRPGS